MLMPTQVIIIFIHFTLFVINIIIAVLFFPHGLYNIESTVIVPPGSRLVGQVLIMMINNSYLIISISLFISLLLY